MGLVRGIPQDVTIVLNIKFAQPINPEEFSVKFRFENADADSHVIGAQDLSENNTLVSVAYTADPMFTGDKITLMNRNVGEKVIYIESVKMDMLGVVEDYVPFGFQNTQLEIL